MKNKQQLLKPYHHGDLEKCLIEAAFSLIKEKKAALFSIREIAKMAHVTHAAAYRHFKSKTALLARIAEMGFTKLNERFQHWQSYSDVKAQLRYLVEAYVIFSVEETGYFRTMFHSDLGDHKKYPSLLNISQKCYQTLSDCVARLKQSRFASEFNTGELTMAIWSSVHGLSVLLIENQFKESDMREDMTLPTRYADSLFRVLSNGIMAKQEFHTEI